MSLPIVLAVGGIGGLAAIARFLLDAAVGARIGGAFPWGTLTVNLSGAFVLGVLSGAALHGDALLLTGTALIGSYTTFSTWMLESVRLGEDGRLALACVNIAGSLACGIGAAELGRLLGGLL